MTTPPPRRIDPVERLRDLASKATPGQWVRDGMYVWIGSVYGIAAVTPRENMAADLQHAAACDPTTILALLDELDAARAVVEAARDVALDCEPGSPLPDVLAVCRYLNRRLAAYDRAIAGDTP